MGRKSFHEKRTKRRARTRVMKSHLSGPMSPRLTHHVVEATSVAGVSGDRRVIRSTGRHADFFDVNMRHEPCPRSFSHVHRAAIHFLPHHLGNKKGGRSREVPTFINPRYQLPLQDTAKCVTTRDWQRVATSPEKRARVQLLGSRGHCRDPLDYLRSARGIL